VRRAGAAGGRRPGAGDEACRGLRRRAHRCPRPSDRPRHDAAAGGGHQAQRRVPDRGRPRPGRGGLVRPHGRGPRRQAADGRGVRWGAGRNVGRGARVGAGRKVRRDVWGGAGRNVRRGSGRNVRRSGRRNDGRGVGVNLAPTWRLLKGGGRRGLLGTWLTLGAVAVSTALLLFAVTANFAFQARGDRDAWRNPVAVGADATAVEAARFDYVRDERMTVVDVA